MIGVEDLGLAMVGESFFQGLGAELRLHRNRQPPGQNPATEPVDNGTEIDEAACHRDIGDVHRPDLIGPGDRHRAEQIWVNLVAQGRLRGVGPAIDRLDAHAPHRRGDMLATNRDALGI